MINLNTKRIMTYDYNEQERTPVSITLENGVSVEGELVDLRITPETIPAGKKWYQFRHTDEDWGDIASLKNGCVAVNFYGTLICDPIPCMEPVGTELGVIDYSFDEP